MSRVLKETRSFLSEKASRLSFAVLGKVSPALLERIQSRRLGATFPRYFDSTETLFIHIPKAAGSSFSMGLYGRQVLHIPSTVWLEISPKKFAKFFKFTVVRDPIDRFVSAFDFLSRGGAGNHPSDLKDARELIRGAELNEWVRLLWTSTQQARIENQVHFRPQTDWVCDGRDNCLMDLIIPLPHADEGYQLVAELIGLDPTVPRINEHKGEKSIPDAQTRKILDLYYAKDRRLYERALADWPSAREVIQRWKETR